MNISSDSPSPMYIWNLNLIDTVPADALAPKIARSYAGTVLAAQETMISTK